MIIDGRGSYGRSKLRNISFARSAKKFPLKVSNITFNALRPGLVDMGLLKTAPGMSTQQWPRGELPVKCTENRLLLNYIKRKVSRSKLARV